MWLNSSFLLHGLRGAFPRCLRIRKLVRVGGHVHWEAGSTARWVGSVLLSAPISRDSAHALRYALLLLYKRFIRLAPQKDLHICQALLFQGAVSELPKLLSDNLVALVVGVYPVWVNLSLLQVYLNIGHVFIGGRRGDVVIDLLYVRLQAPNVFYFPFARPGSNGIVNKDFGSMAYAYRADDGIAGRA